MAQPKTGLSPEWDRWFDETFADLVSSDEELTRSEFAALITASWPPPAPSGTVDPSGHHGDSGVGTWPTADGATSWPALSGE
jgi:hypothetical protein